MVRDTRVAGVDERLRRQVAQSANLLQSSYNKCSVAQWDGASFDVLVAAGATGSGQSALVVAAGRGISTIEVAGSQTGSGRLSGRPKTSTALLTRTLSAALGDVGPEEVA